MTWREITVVKHLIDKRRRELEQVGAEFGYGPGRCDGCGCDHDARTTGCRPCQGRHRRRQGRPAPTIHNAAGYSNGCRCPVCTVANNVRTRDWRRRTRDAA